jgi:ADP-ribose pyrophosphatase YjhB (NUDIX family)
VIRATAVLIEGDRILLVEQRVAESATRGRAWSLPGGTLEPGETLAECLIREVKEETGLVVALERLLYVCFDERFRRLALERFPGCGAYRGAVSSIGL